MAQESRPFWYRRRLRQHSTALPLPLRQAQKIAELMQIRSLAEVKRTIAATVRNQKPGRRALYALHNLRVQGPRQFGQTTSRSSSPSMCYIVLTDPAKAKVKES